ncbi:MAG: efflux RND transporter periplasmic adaptor subunit [Verrucomicrobia bacterium]|jgi:HlyD family secretion protein|nr:efflux RND transporter periplasmic adaptor subunit [Verrucomicrobiota bacterium]
MAKKKKSSRKWILLAVVLVVIGGMVVATRTGGEEGIEVSVESIESGDITSVVTATGRVHPQTEVVISSEVPGEVIELPVKDGSTVEKGDLLVRVNPDTLEAQVKQREASLAGTRAASAQQRAEMLQAELDLDRIRELHEKGFATEEELDRAKTSLEVRRAAYESGQHEIERQEMQLKEARDKLAKASIFSPMNGTVIALNAEVGDRVVGTGQFEGTEIMRVADLTAMEVQVDVSEADIVHVEMGDKAEVEIDALPEEPFTGAVTEIANSALTTDARSREEVTTFAVTIELDDPGKQLRPGMTATADIETETVTGVVKAPLGSVVVRPESEVSEASDETDESDEADESDDRVRVVFVAADGRAELRRVETGIADRDFIEIKEGLAEGDRVITGSYRALTRELEDGSVIRERKRGESGQGGDWRDEGEG